MYHASLNCISREFCSLLVNFHEKGESLIKGAQGAVLYSLSPDSETCLTEGISLQQMGFNFKDIFLKCKTVPN